MTKRKFLVADLFAGAGGSSTGAERAILAAGDQMELVAVNHWPVAVQTHSLNHPSARHYVEDVEHADPEAIVPEGRLDLLMASPECKYHSRAKGGKPIHDQGRMSPWAILNWLTKLDVRCVLIESTDCRTLVGTPGQRQQQPDAQAHCHVDHGGQRQRAAAVPQPIGLSAKGKASAGRTEHLGSTPSASNR